MTSPRTSGALLLLTAQLACAEPEQAQAGSEPAAAPVVVARAEAGVLASEHVFPGQVRAMQAAALGFGTQGRVLTVEVREGDRVELGQLLATLDPRQARAQMAAASSNLDEVEHELSQARREAGRARDLGAQVLAGESIERELGRAEAFAARRDRRHAELRAARVGLSEHQLRAPFAGVVRTREVDAGGWVAAGQAVLELVAEGPVEVRAAVSPTLREQLGVGGATSLRPSLGSTPERAAGDPAELTAEIVAISAIVEPVTQTVEVRLSPRGQGWLLPGMIVQVGVPVRHEAPGAVVVPRDAVVQGAAETRVLKVLDGHACAVRVELLAMAGASALVLGAGLGPGDVVVTRGNERLADRQDVRIVEARE